MSSSYRLTSLGFCVFYLFFTRASLFMLGLVFVLCVFPLCCWLVFSTGAVDCLERLVSEMTYYVLSGLLNHTYSLTRYLLNILVLSWPNVGPVRRT